MKKIILVLTFLGSFYNVKAQLGINKDDALEISNINGSTSSNNMMRKIWLYRYKDGNDWYSASLHDAIAIDASFLQPQVNTRTWWQRDPGNEIQSWGTRNWTFMTLKGGKLGIGTTDPKTQLDIQSSQNGWMMSSRVTANSPGEINGLKFYSGYPGEDKWAGIASVCENLHSIKTGLSLYSGMAERVRISGDGKVGIGTTDPKTLLDVQSLQNGWLMSSRVTAVSPGEINGLKFYSGYPGDDKWAGIASVAESLHSGKTGLSLYSGMAERVRISGDGKVGIGTTDPKTPLDIQSSQNGWMMSSRVTAKSPGEINGFKFYSGYPGDDKWAGIASVVEDLHSNSTGFSIYTSQTEKLRVTGDGKVGIGTSNPTELFNVNGNAQLDRLRLGNAIFSGNSRNSINSFNTGQDANLHTGWIAADFGGSDNASDRLVVGSGFGGRTIIGTHNYNLTQWGGDLIINPTGSKVGIGTYEPKEMLSVNGKIAAVEIRVNGAGAPDYVFEDGYKVETLEALESYIKVNKHLPEVPSAKEFERDGMAIGEMNKLLLKKIEELTLHLIEKNKQLAEEKEKNQSQEERITKLEILFKSKK
jgi:hypothetical protein